MNRPVRLLLAAALAAVAAGSGTATADDTTAKCPTVVTHDPCPAGCIEVAATGAWHVCVPFTEHPESS